MYSIFSAGVLGWPPFVFVAEAAPNTTIEGGFSSLSLGLAALIGMALGLGLSWFFLRRKSGNAGAEQSLLSRTPVPAELNAGNSLTTGFIHEFNNTLCTILGFSDLAILRSSGAGPDRQGLEQIRIGAQRSTQLLEQLERFHMETGIAQPVPLGLLLKGYGKWVQRCQTSKAGEPAKFKETAVRFSVQVQDMATLVLAQPVQVQRLLALLHQAAMAAAEKQQVQLVLRQAVFDGAAEQSGRLELVLQGAAVLSAASTKELEQLTSELGGSLTIVGEQDGTTTYRLSLPGQPASVSFH